MRTALINLRLSRISPRSFLQEGTERVLDTCNCLQQLCLSAILHIFGMSAYALRLLAQVYFHSVLLSLPQVLHAHTNTADTVLENRMSYQHVCANTKCIAFGPVIPLSPYSTSEGKKKKKSWTNYYRFTTP